MTWDVLLTSTLVVTCILLLTGSICSTDERLPLVINTWAYFQATEAAWRSFEKRPYTPLDALVNGIGECERVQCDLKVGKGGCPDGRGETTLDSMIMDGATQNMGAVAGLREVNHAIGVARIVLEHTTHSLLVGNAATDFAVSMGFPRESLSTENSTAVWREWRKNNCQPNFWRDMWPNPRESCGPYQPDFINDNDFPFTLDENNHDTIGMIVIDAAGRIFAGTSTNGLAYKIPGRVGDSVIPGGGAYADNEVGAAVATGYGDEMMRFLPSLIAVEGMRNGLSPREAAIKALNRIHKKHPRIKGALVVADRKGNYAAVCLGFDEFSYAVNTREIRKKYNGTKIEYIKCLHS